MRLFLSTNSTISTSDTQLNECSLPAINAGSSQNGNCSGTVPSSYPTGSDYIGILADASGVVTESSNSNNDDSVSITITSGSVSTETDCSNGIDDDSDGDIDCDDSDCSGDSSCSTIVDNDGDEYAGGISIVV